MRLLLDTHAFLWAASAPERFAEKARRAIENTENEVFVSAAVAWEIALKHGLGKLTLPSDPPAYVPATTAALGFRDLSISAAHALAVWSLPHHHNDPIDRILVAQAASEDMTLVTNDAAILRYRVRILPAA